MEEIEKLQPYHETIHPERHLLAVLNHINNMNKHRALPATIVTVPRLQFTMGSPLLGGTNLNVNHWLERPIEDGAEFCRVSFDPPLAPLELQLADPPLRVAFLDELDHSDGWTYTNADLIRWVSDTVGIFEPAFAS